MIRLTHLSGAPFVLNAELIRYVESRPDTYITLTTGDRVIVRETLDAVLALALDYQRSKHLIPEPKMFRRTSETAVASGEHHEVA